jgi:hypothetical protein
MLWFGYEMFPEAYVFNTWSPDCGIILGVVETLGGDAYLDEMSHFEGYTKFILVRLFSFMLLFFLSLSLSGKKAGHVGMYLSSQKA